MWMDENRLAPKNSLASDDFPTNNTVASTMVSKRCEVDFATMARLEAMHPCVGQETWHANCMTQAEPGQVPPH